MFLFLFFLPQGIECLSVRAFNVSVILHACPITRVMVIHVGFLT